MSEKLFGKDLVGIDLYPYFENLLHPELAGKKLTVPMAEGYYLSLPFEVVSPEMYCESSRIPIALGIRRETLEELCRGVSVILPKDEIPAEIDPPHYPFREDMIVRSVSFKGLFGVDAFRYLCKTYLDGYMPQDAIINRVYVDITTATALSFGFLEFRYDAKRALYLKIFSRIKRIISMYRKDAPALIMKNEKMLLMKALEDLYSLYQA